MKKWWLLVLIIIIGAVIVFFWRESKIVLLNPKSSEKNVSNSKNNYKVVGFLPTWNIGETREYTNEISELIFLGIEVDENGSLIWDTQSKKINNETYLKQKNLIWKNGGKNILGIKLFNDEKLDKLLGSEEAKNNLIKQLTDLLKENKFDGINVDFEYQNSPVLILSDNMNDFLNKLKKADLGEISLDVFANTIIKGSAEQINKTIGLTDNLIVMAYDFHRPGTDFTGAVAPIEDEVGSRNILEVTERIEILNLERKKIVMAYPLYGYEWKTYTTEFGAQAKKGWSALATYKRTEELVNSGGLSDLSVVNEIKNWKVNWDEKTMTPWINYQKEGENYQIYYENKESLKRKVDLVKQNQLGGYGFWALGYEGNESNLLNELK